MSSPKHYPTYKVAKTSELAKSLDVSDPNAVSAEDHGVILCRGYGRIDSTAVTDDYFIQFLQGPELPGDGVNIIHFVTPITISHVNGVHSTFDFDFGSDFVKCRSGLWVVVSTTEYTKTIVATNIMSSTVFYHQG